MRLGHYPLALEDFGEALKRRPDLPEVFLNRALVLEALKKTDLAISDVNEAIRLGLVTHKSLLVRARLREALGDKAGSRKDRERALNLEPHDEEGFLSRGVARLKKGDVPGALSDFKEAVAHNPRSLGGFANQANVLAGTLNEPREAIAVLDRLLQLYPQLARVYADRGLLSARLGDREAALRDARQARSHLKCDDPRTTGEMLYLVAEIYAQTSRQNPADKDVALRLLKEAIRTGYGHDRLESDPDLSPIREEPGFRDLLNVARILKSRFGRN
jgi:tetratricopeptide (TPR) repeat protein